MITISRKGGVVRLTKTAGNPRAQPTEDQEAIAFMDEVRWRFPAHGDLVLHIANEGAKAATVGQAMARAGKLRAQGQVAGTSDYFVAVPNVMHLYGGLWLELKARDGALRPNQLAFLDRMSVSSCYAAAVAWGAKAAIVAVDMYLRGHWPVAPAKGCQIIGFCADGNVHLLSELTLTGTIRRRNGGGTCTKT